MRAKATDKGSGRGEKSPGLQITVITANAAGGARLAERNPQLLAAAFATRQPDFIFLQELIKCEGAKAGPEDSLRELTKETELEGYRSVFKVTVDSKDQPCPPVVPGTDGRPGKWFSERFMPYTYAAQGNGFLLAPEWSVQGRTGSVVITNFCSAFLGDRETEPRRLVTVAVERAERNAQILLACTHLTPLRDEEDDDKKAKVASAVRQQQVRKICEVLAQRTGAPPVILAGDFNAVPGSAELELLADAGFERVTRLCSDREQYVGTHRRTGRFIDHIWVRPPEKLVALECGLLDAGLEEGKATDHRPVWATIELRL